MKQPQYVIPEGRIVKAAIQFRDKLYTGWRHADIRNQIMEETQAPREEIMHAVHDPWKVGFVTDNGRFLTRKQALIYARNRNQVGEICGLELTSEDLWEADGTPKEPIKELE